MAKQVVWGFGQVLFFQGDAFAEAVEEGELEVGGLTEGSMRADFYTVTTKDAAVEGKCVACQVAFGHH